MTSVNSPAVSSTSIEWPAPLRVMRTCCGPGDIVHPSGSCHSAVKARQSNGQP